MSRRLLLHGIYCLAIMMISACSQTYQVTTASTTALKKELREMSSTITSFSCSFTRPQLTCKVALTQEPDDQLLDSILAKMKTFSTVERLDELARKAHWNDHVWTVRLIVGTDMKKQAPQYEYSASYYRYNINHSIQEVDGYQTWEAQRIDN